MAGEMITTIVGNLGGDPELKFLPSGKPVCKFSVASTPRKFNKDSGKWEAGETTWVSVSAWDALGENIAESLTKGMRVIVTGALENRKYTAQDGSDRWSLDMRADAVGPDLTWVTAKIGDGAHQGASNGGANNGNGGRQSAPAQPANPPSDDW